MDRRVLPIGLFLLLGAASVLQLPTATQAAYVNVDGHLIEGFENATFPNNPASPYYTFATTASTSPAATGSAVISTVGVPSGSPTPESGTRSLRVNQQTTGGVGSSFLTTFDLGTNLCQTGRTIDFHVYYASGNAYTEIGLSNTARTDLFELGVFHNAGTYTDAITFDNSATASTSNLAIDYLATNQWHWIGFSCTNLSALVIFYDTGITRQITLGSGTVSLNRVSIRQSDQSTGIGAAAFVDRINFGAPPAVLPTISTTTATVTGLVGYSMDGMGQNIVVRTNSGTTVASYNAEDLTTSIGTATTGCSRSDGVVSSFLNDEHDNDGGVWITYADCPNSAGTVDALRIRTASLGTPTFPSPCDGQATQNVVNDPGNIDVPNNMAQLGTLSDMAFDFRECINTGNHYAIASWTFSSSTDGWIGAFAAGYNDAAFNGDDSFEEHAPALDVSTTKQVDDFCSWRGPDGNDYIGGVSQNGATGVYQVIRNANVDLGQELDVDFTFNQKFRNTGTYASSFGIDCAQDRVVVATPGYVRVLANVTTVPQTAAGWPKAITTAATRMVAITGSGEYIAVKDGSTIKVYGFNGTQTGADITVPGGTWKGMEFDYAGQKLAIFTSTTIMVANTAAATCDLDANCEELGGIADDGSNGRRTTSSSSSSTRGPGDLDLGGDSFLGNDEAGVQAAVQVFADLGAILTAAVFGILPLWLILLGVLVAAVFVVMRMR